MKTCTCGRDMEFKRGTSKKTGKPYSGWFCNKETGGCGEALFDKTAQGQGRYVPAEKRPVASEKTMVLSYAKDVVCARIRVGEKLDNPIDEILRGYKILLTAITEMP